MLSPAPVTSSPLHISRAMWSAQRPESIADSARFPQDESFLSTQRHEHWPEPTVTPFPDQFHGRLQ
jgi:hypothetical protein